VLNERIGTGGFQTMKLACAFVRVSDSFWVKTTETRRREENTKKYEERRCKELLTSLSSSSSSYLRVSNIHILKDPLGLYFHILCALSVFVV